jgi:hypothetical protein
MKNNVAAEQEKINMRAMGDPVFVKVGLFVGKVQAGKVVPDGQWVDVPAVVEPEVKDADGKVIQEAKVVKEATKRFDGVRLAADRVVKVGFLGTQYEFKPDVEQMVPRAAVKDWMQHNQNIWEDKIVFEVREPAKLVPSEVKAKEEADLKAKLMAEIEAEIKGKADKDHQAALAAALAQSNEDHQKEMEALKEKLKAGGGKGK